MRKYILITAMVLASATAHAGERNLTRVASSDEPAVTAPAKPADAEPAAAPTSPQYVERPSVTPATDCAPKASADAPKVAPRETTASEKPRRRHISTEARVISELHRHGIYW